MSSNCQSAWGSVGVEALRRRTRLEVDADSSSNVLAQSLIKPEQVPKPHNTEHLFAFDYFK